MCGIGEGNGNPLQCSCLENPRDGGAWWAAVYEVAQSRTRLKRLSSSSRNNLGEGSGTPFQYSCLENPMDGGAWWAAVHGVAKNLTWLSNFTFTFMHWRRRWQPIPVFLPGESQGQGSLVATVYGVTQSRTQLKRLSSSSSIIYVEIRESVGEAHILMIY